MTNEADSTDIVRASSYSADIQLFESAILGFIERHGLPTESILVPVRERTAVFKNIDEVVAKIDDERKQRSIYLSKFIAAAASGLFDAALNYLWDETIYELRYRVKHYDLSYFYDVAVGNSDKRKKLTSEDDLVKIDDSELIRGANEIGLISDLGYKHLDNIRYMRNWASAAHPNQNQITGLQLVSMLETCVIEVIKLPLSTVVAEIKKLLHNIKNNQVSESEATQIAVFFANLPQDRKDTLGLGLFGIYTQIDTTSQTRQNIHLILPKLWDFIDDNTKQQFGIKYARFLANNDQAQQKLARQFLEVVSGMKYIPDGIRAAEIATAIENLLSAHRNINNFYNEPPFARQLQRLVGESGKVPSEINSAYVLGLVEVFLTNGNGVAWNAASIYKSMIDAFDPAQAFIAVTSFDNKTIESRLQFPLCQKQFRALLSMMINKVTMPAVKELIEVIENFKGPIDKIKEDTMVRRKINALRKIISS